MNHPDLLFIYGTLLPGLKLEREMTGAEYLGAAQVRGDLYDIGTYPGLVAGPGLVSGEIYRVSAEHLLHLDSVEEVVANNPAASLYLRERIKVVTGNFAGQLVWVYIYNRSVERLRLLSGGDYRAYLFGTKRNT
jgi:gamma-glutamylcyclotransferase (GGCT)/AIG2-like uncharacterized protein YtfP